MLVWGKRLVTLCTQDGCACSEFMQVGNGGRAITCEAGEVEVQQNEHRQREEGPPDPNRHFTYFLFAVIFLRHVMVLLGTVVSVHAVHTKFAHGKDQHQYRPTNEGAARGDPPGHDCHTNGINQRINNEGISGRTTTCEGVPGRDTTCARPDPAP